MYKKIFLFLFILLLSPLAFATNPGDVCTDAGSTTVSGSTTLVCNGSTWQLVYQVENSGQMNLGYAVKLSTNGVCNGSNEAALRWNTSEKKPEYCDGTDWVVMVDTASGGGTSDPHWSNVVLLVQPEETSTTISDISTAAHSITLMDNANLTNLIADPWGGNRKVITYDGVGDYLNLGDYADWSFSTGTIEVWARSENIAEANQNYLAIWTSGAAADGNAFSLTVGGNTAGCFIANTSSGGGYYTLGTTSAVGNQFYHIALVVDSGNYTCYVNGSQVGYAARGYGLPDESVTLKSGAFYTGSTWWYSDGQVGAIRITKNVARTPAEFMYAAPAPTQ